jgi:UDP-galactopyranose mutase
MSRDQNAGRNHNIRIHNSSFERVEEFKYLETALTNQNSVQEEVKGRLKSGNAYYYSVQNLFSSRLLPKNLKIRIYRNIIMPVAYMGVKLGR